jgi:hypothetical protein
VAEMPFAREGNDEFKLIEHAEPGPVLSAPE